MEVKFKLDADGVAPNRDNGLLKIMSPLPVDLRAGGSVVVRTGVSFNVPVLLVQGSTTAGVAVRLKNAGAVVHPGDDVELFLSNEALPVVEETAMFERGDVLAYAIPLVGNFDLVNG